MARDDAETAESTHGRATGLFASLQKLLASFAEIIHTRIEIFSIEVEEAGWLVRQLIFLALVSVLFLGVGLLVATLFVVKASPETYQLYVLGGFAMLYLIIGVIAAFAVRNKLNNRPPLFATTLSELEKDRNHLEKRL